MAIPAAASKFARHAIPSRKYMLPIFLMITVLVFYCEVLLYYMVLLQCTWPQLPHNTGLIVEADNSLKAIILADPHLLGVYRGHWFDKLRREWQMYRAFQTAITIHDPKVVFILGDLFDEGQWGNDSVFNYYVQRFHNMFYVPSGTDLYVVAGNHDMGFHYRINPRLKKRFEKAFNTSSVEFLQIKGNIFVTINSMAMEGDGCKLCEEAEYKLQALSQKLGACTNSNGQSNVDYCRSQTRPVLLQHFPLYRESDSICSEPDSAPPAIKEEPFREKWECLSKNATKQVLEALNPRAVFSGHSHHGCYVEHTEKKIPEWTIASFNWRNKNDPSFILAVFTPENYAINKCYMPRENTVIATYITGAAFILLWVACKRILSKH